MALVTSENHELVPYLAGRPFLARSMVRAGGGSRPGAVCRQVLVTETVSPPAQPGVSVAKGCAPQALKPHGAPKSSAAWKAL